MGKFAEEIFAFSKKTIINCKRVVYEEARGFCDNQSESVIYRLARLDELFNGDDSVSVSVKTSKDVVHGTLDITSVILKLKFIILIGALRPMSRVLDFCDCRSLSLSG